MKTDDSDEEKLESPMLRLACARERYLCFRVALHLAQRARWASAILFLAAADMGLRLPEVVRLPTALEPPVPTSPKTFRAVSS
jgi:hypothetical protein